MFLGFGVCGSDWILLDGLILVYAFRVSYRHQPSSAYILTLTLNCFFLVSHFKSRFFFSFFYDIFILKLIFEKRKSYVWLLGGWFEDVEV